MKLQQKDWISNRWRSVLGEAQLESMMQIQLVQLLKVCVRSDVLWFHPPNGEMRDVRTGAKLRAMGVLAGLPDLMFNWVELVDGIKMRRVLHLELKRRGGRQNEAQAAFQLAVMLLGDQYFVCDSIDEAIAILGEHGLIRRDVEVCGRRW
jgi:hypothetical protein